MMHVKASSSPLTVASHAVVALVLGLPIESASVEAGLRWSGLPISPAALLSPGQVSDLEICLFCAHRGRVAGCRECQELRRTVRSRASEAPASRRPPVWSAVLRVAAALASSDRLSDVELEGLIGRDLLGEWRHAQG